VVQTLSPKFKTIKLEKENELKDSKSKGNCRKNVA
jgi:hypothetical protein